LRYTVPEIIAAGNKVISYALADGLGRSTTGAIGLTVNPCPSRGPDVIVANLTDVNYYGALGNISAYSLGTNACNIGDLPVIWIQGGTQHPVIAQNIYRLKNGRFEQIGQSFLKHSFQSLNSPGCATCVQPPMGGAQLGVGCSDVYGAGYNGSQGNLGRRSTVNPTTGVFSWPPPPPATDAIGQRLQVFTSDIDPSLNQGALYFGEAQYVTADDAQWVNPLNSGTPATNGLNNASYQRLSIPDVNATPTRQRLDLLCESIPRLNDVISASAKRKFPLRRSTGTCDHLDAQRRSNFDTSQPGSRARTEHQQGLTGLDFGPPQQGGVRRSVRVR
jgi:hypothetical protein